MHDVIFVPEEDPDGYLLFYPQHIPAIGQQVTLQSNEQETHTYEVTKVEHHWKRIVSWDKEDERKVRDNQDYTTIVYGQHIRSEEE